MNIDEKKIEQAITDKTRVIIAMHYAGVACEMDAIMDLARRHGLMVVEDAAQGVMSTYKGPGAGHHRRFRLLLLPRDQKLLHGRGRCAHHQQRGL